jgi:regulator of protease activity HflC (stomatin/prohibitin superfamily)
VLKERVYSAYYVLSDAHSQMKAYVYDSIRASLCHMTLDHAFESKEEISMSLKTHLQEIMNAYGFSILSALITDLAPDVRVREAMNEINASKRLKESAYQRAEGEKILKVKRAEAEAESMYLSGVGVSRERKAIMDGLKASIVEFQHAASTTKPKEIMDLLVLNQYFDTLQELGSSNSKCIFLASDSSNFRTQLMEAQAALNP